MADGNGQVEGVTLREYIELLVRAEVNELKVVMAERIEAVHTAYERHEAEHGVIGKDMEHLNQLRQEVTQDRERLMPLIAFNTYRDSVSGWMTLMGNQFATMRGQVAGAMFVLGIVFTAVQIVIAIYR